MGRIHVLTDAGVDDILSSRSFTIWRFEQLMKNPLKYRPLVNQVELSYWNPQPSLIAVCAIASQSLKRPLTVCHHSVGKVAEGAVGSFIAARWHEES